jgi:hypothetical protein
MPLDIEPRSGEDFIPYVKFDAKAGRWFSKQDGGGEEEVRDMTAIFDLANIKLGWLYFNEGTAPDAVWDNGKAAQQPTPQHKRGFSVNLFSPQKIGGLRELRSNSNAAINAIKTLYEQEYETAPEAAKGLVPVVTCESVRPVKSKFGTNYEPVLKIAKWVPRPEALKADEKPAKAATIEETVPPPMSRVSATARTPEPDTGDLEEF